MDDAERCELYDPDAQQKCEDLVDSLCLGASQNCFPTILFEVCVEEFNESFGCEATFGVSDSYDECLELLDTTESCWVDVELPDACNGVLVYVE